MPSTEMDRQFIVDQRSHVIACVGLSRWWGWVGGGSRRIIDLAQRANSETEYRSAPGWRDSDPAGLAVPVSGLNPSVKRSPVRSGRSAVCSRTINWACSNAR